jgi:hypothetical protein
LTAESDRNTREGFASSSPVFSFLTPPSSLFFNKKNGGAQGVLNCAGEGRAKSALLKRHNIIVATE